MSSLVVSEVLSPGMDVRLRQLSPEELFQYATYARLKPMFHVPDIRKRYLLVTDSQLVDMIAHPFQKSMATVTDVHNMSDVLKVKFKKDEVISLTFVGDKVQQYGMKETDKCLEYIRLKLTERGIKSNLLLNRYKKNIANAQGLLDTIREIERDFEKEPSHNLVVIVIDLLRDAVELFGEADDSRYLQALEHIQTFLQRPDVAAILDAMATTKRTGSISTGSTAEHGTPTGVEGRLSGRATHLSVRLAQQVGDIIGSPVESPKGKQSPITAYNPENVNRVSATMSSNTISTAVPRAPLSIRLNQQAGEGSFVGSPKGSKQSPMVSRSPKTLSPAVFTFEGVDNSRRKLSTGSAGESGAATRPRVASKIRRRSIRTQSIENAQFRTMDSLHFDDAEDALWIEDEELPGGDIDKNYDIVDDENIALLDSMIGNMTHELEDIIGETVDLDDEVLEYVTSGRQSDELGFTLSRGLSSVEDVDKI